MELNHICIIGLGLLEGVQLATTLEAALEDAELILLPVRNRQFLELTPNTIAGRTAARRVIDAVNAWSSNEWKEAGIKAHTLDVGSLQPVPAIEK